MTNLESILKSRDVTLLTKVHIVKSMVFPKTVELRVDGNLGVHELDCEES